MDKSDIFEYISSMSSSKIVNPSEIKMRCFLCGDGKSNKKQRLYIKINRNKQAEPIYYHCFNCLRQGILTSDILKLSGIMNKDLLDSIDELNKISTKGGGSNVISRSNIFDREVSNIIIPKYHIDSEVIERKVEYLRGRIGCDIPIEDFKKLKLILSVKDFLKENGIVKRKSSFLDSLENDYIGVLSNSKRSIIFRDITGTKRMRYRKYSVYKYNIGNFYTIGNKVDIFTDDEIDIVIAEGWFDIISVFYNVYNGDSTNKIFIASCSGSFKSPLLYYISRGLVGKNINIKCYKDSDTRINFKSLYKILKPYIGSFEVIYNAIYKDFGVPKSSIQAEHQPFISIKGHKIKKRRKRRRRRHAKSKRTN